MLSPPAKKVVARKQLVAENQKLDNELVGYYINCAPLSLSTGNENYPIAFTLLQITLASYIIQRLTMV